jgi:AAA domain
VRTSDQIALVREMVAEVDAEIAAASRADRAGPYPFEATLVGRAAQRWLYEFRTPPRGAFSDAPVDVQSNGKQVAGWVASVTDGTCTIAVDADLGARATGWVDVDTAGPLRALHSRLTNLAPELRVAQGRTFQFDQAALVLGAPGGRLRDEIARAAESTDNWSLDDRQSQVLGTAMRHRWAFVQPPPDGNATTLLVALLERLLELDASVLLVSPHAAAVDWSLHTLCDRLRPHGEVRSGVFQRIGPIAVRALEERHGPLVDPDIIAADLNAELDRQSAALDEAELKLRYQDAVARYAEVEEIHEDLTDRLERARHRRGLVRIGRNTDKPDELVVELHKLRPRRAAAKQNRDNIAAQLAALQEAEIKPNPAVVPIEQAATFTGRLRQITDARDGLVDARATIEEALRQRCRLVATTTGQAFVRRLPRTQFDVVVIVGRISRPEAFYLAGLSTRSVIAVGAPQAAGTVGARPLPHAARGGIGLGRSAAQSHAAQSHGVASRTRHFPAPASD